MTSLRTLQQIKDSIDSRISNCFIDKLSLAESLEIIKISVEDVIRSSGESPGTLDIQGFYHKVFFRFFVCLKMKLQYTFVRQILFCD